MKKYLIILIVILVFFFLKINEVKATSGCNFFTNEIDVTPVATGSWTDVDVSDDGVPAGATGVILRLDVPDSGDNTIAVRENGSTDTRTPIIPYNSHAGAIVGIDSNRIFEAYIGQTTNKIYLIGYTTDGTDFFTNSVDVTPGSTGDWVDVDVSDDGVPAGATGVIVEIVHPGGATEYNGGIRKNGSTDTFTYGGTLDYAAHLYQVCGVDANRVFEAKIDNTALKLYLIGYFMPPVSFETNAVDKTLGVDSTWTDINVTHGSAPANADGALWLIADTVQRSSGVRKNGSTDTGTGETTGTTGATALFCGLDASRVAEGIVGWSEPISTKHYIIGYAEPAAENKRYLIMD